MWRQQCGGGGWVGVPRSGFGSGVIPHFPVSCPKLGPQILSLRTLKTCALSPPTSAAGFGGWNGALPRSSVGLGCGQDFQSSSPMAQGGVGRDRCLRWKWQQLGQEGPPAPHFKDLALEALGSLTPAFQKLAVSEGNAAATCSRLVQHRCVLANRAGGRGSRSPIVRPQPAPAPRAIAPPFKYCSQSWFCCRIQLPADINPDTDPSTGPLPFT